MAVTVQINQAQLESLNALLTSLGNDANKVTKRAVKRTITTVKTAAAKEIGQVSTLKAADIKQAIVSNLQVTSQNGGVAVGGSIRISNGLATPLFKFRTNPANPRRTRNGVSVKIYKNRGGTRIRNAFVARMPSGHVGVFKRKRGANNQPVNRLGIVELVGPSIATLFTMTPGLSERIETLALEKLQTNLEREINYLLSRRT